MEKNNILATINKCNYIIEYIMYKIVYSINISMLLKNDY